MEMGPDKMIKKPVEKMFVPEGRPAREHRGFPGKEEDDDYA